MNKMTHHIRLPRNLKVDTEIENERYKCTQLKYEAYLERYHNELSAINILRTKTALLLGFLGVIVTLLLSLLLTNSYSINPANLIISNTGVTGELFNLSFEFSNLIILPNEIFDNANNVLMMIILSYFMICGCYFVAFNHLYMRSRSYPDNEVFDKLKKLEIVSPQNHYDIFIDNLVEKITELSGISKLYSNMLLVTDLMFMACVAISIISFTNLFGSVAAENLAIYVFVLSLLLSLILVTSISLLLIILLGRFIPFFNKCFVSSDWNFILPLVILAVILWFSFFFHIYIME